MPHKCFRGTPSIRISLEGYKIETIIWKPENLKRKKGFVMVFVFPVISRTCVQGMLSSRVRCLQGSSKHASKMFPWHPVYKHFSWNDHIKSWCGVTFPWFYYEANKWLATIWKPENLKRKKGCVMVFVFPVISRTCVQGMLSSRVRCLQGSSKHASKMFPWYPVYKDFSWRVQNRNDHMKTWKPEAKKRLCDGFRVSGDIQNLCAGDAIFPRQVPSG